MQVFKAFFKTARRSLPINIMYFIIFSGVALFLSRSSVDTDSQAFASVALDVAVIDADRSDASAALTGYLAGIHNLTKLEYDREALLDRLFYRDIDFVLILPKGFEEKLSGGETDLYETMRIPGVYSSVFVEGQINTYLKAVRLYLAGGKSLADAQSHTEKALNAAAGQVRVLAQQEDGASGMKGIYYYYQFLPYVILSMILSGITPILTTFWEEGLAKRISCSSLGLSAKNLQLALGSIVYCFGIWALFQLIARIFYGNVLFRETGLLCMANSIMILPAAAAVALIISCFHPSSSMVSMCNNVITLGMCFLCGVFIPQQQLGSNVCAVSKFLPFYWYIRNNDLVSGFGGTPFAGGAYWENIGVQALFAAALFALALSVSKYRRGK